MSTPAPPPEAALIRVARQAAGLSIAAAAQAAIIDISLPRWSQIETGYEIRRGKAKPVRARDDTIAHMAYVTGVSPARLDQAGRPEAAEVLREIHRRQDARSTVPEGTESLDGLTPEEIRIVRDFVGMLRARSAAQEPGERSAGNGA